MAERIIKGKRCFDKPGELCYEVEPGWYTDEGMFDNDDEWLKIMEKITAEESMNREQGVKQKENRRAKKVNKNHAR